MRFDQTLTPGTLLKRYQRFLADIQLEDGRIITVYCPNTGSMRGIKEPGIPVMISRSANPARKYPHTLELVRVGKSWVGINTNRANQLVREALENRVITELQPFDQLRSEVKLGRSRLDFLLTNRGRQTWLEVKNCTMATGATAGFPDAITTRGARHLRELLKVHRAGQGAALIFCVQRQDVDHFRPAREIDPVYAETLLSCRQAGVLILAYQAKVNPQEITITTSLPVST